MHNVKRFHEKLNVYIYKEKKLTMASLVLCTIILRFLNNSVEKEEEHNKENMNAVRLSKNNFRALIALKPHHDNTS